jgi:hypothetical protein
VAPAEPIVARHADAPLQRALPQRSARPTVEPEPAVVVVRAEQEVVTTPRPVRAFIDATPLTAQPEAPPEPQPEPVAYVEPDPEPEPVAYIEPDPEPEPVAYTEPDPEPEPVAYIEPDPEPEPVAYVEPAAVESEPEPRPAAAAGKHAAIRPEPAVEPPDEDFVAGSGQGFVEDPVEPSAEPSAQPVVAESVVSEAEPERVLEPTLEPVSYAEPEPDPQPDPEPVSYAEPEPDPPARRSFLDRARREPKEPKAPEEAKPRRAARPSTGDAARDLVAAKARDRAINPLPATPEPPAAALAPMPAAVAVAEAPEAEPAPAAAKVGKHDQVAAEMPGVYRFTPKRTSRRLLTIALLIGLVASAYFVRDAVEIKETAAIGLATIVVMATAMVWAIRAGASVTKLEVHQGQLTVIQQGGRFIFDLASQYTNIEVHGSPGRRGWKVLFPRRGMATFKVDASMVDPDDFMRVLRFFRPQLVDH